MTTTLANRHARRQRHSRLLMTVVCLITACASAGAVLAWDAAFNRLETGAPTAVARAAPNPPAPRATLNRKQAQYLVRSVLKSVFDASQSGNYSVVRDLAAAQFRERYSLVQLSNYFAGVRVPSSLQSVLAEPVIGSATTVADGQAVLLRGHTAAGHEPPVRFAVTFIPVNNSWKFVNIALDGPVRTSALIPATDGRVP